MLCLAKFFRLVASLACNGTLHATVRYVTRDLRVYGLVMAVVLTITCMQRATQAKGRGLLSEEQLREIVLTTQARINSLSLAYEVQYNQDAEELRIRRQVLMLEPFFFIHDSVKARSHQNYDLSLDWQRAYLDGRFEVNTYPQRRMYYKRDWNPSDGLPGTLSQELSVLATGIWPLECCTPPEPFGHPHVLREVAAEPGFRLSKQLDVVRGHECHVLVYGDDEDTIWLDASRGGVIMKRKLRRSTDGITLAEYECGDYHQLEDGIWMPTWFSHVHYKHDSPVPHELKEKKVTATARVLSVVINEYGVADLVFRPERGSIRFDPDQVSASPINYTRGGVRYLDQVAQWITHASDFSHDTTQKVPGSAGPLDRLQALRNPWLGLACGCFLGLGFNCVSSALKH